MTIVTLIKVELSIIDRWAVGRVAEGDVSLPVVVDPRSGPPYRPYVPGSSLAGSLRRHLGQDLADTWLAPEPGEWERAAASEKIKSPLGFLGTFAVDSRVEVRGSTSVDPMRGAALKGGLRHEQWNQPTKVQLALDHDGPHNDELISCLASWEPIVGRGASAGMGRAHVTSVDWVTLDLSVEAEVSWWLTSRVDWYRPEETAIPVSADHGTQRGSDRRSPARYALDTSWEVAEPVHIGTGTKETATQVMPEGRQPELLTVMRLGSKPVIPGSSWKGVFRHRVECILSVLDGGPEVTKDVVEALFGSLSNGVGLLGFADSVLPDRTVQRNHVAIDRFTGGARDGALFKVEAVDRGTRVQLSISSRRELPEPVRNLLGHVMRDLHEGLTGVGGMGTRGYGHVKLTHGFEFNTLAGVDPAEILRSLTTDQVTTQEARP